MKQKQLMAMLALCLAFGYPTSELASLIVKINAAVFDVRKVATEADLRVALQQPEITTIVLTAHLIINDPVVINRRTELTLDLNGHNIVACRRNHGGFSLKGARSNDACVLDIQAGNIIITGHGHIMALSANSTAIRMRGAMTAENSNYSCLKVERDVVLNAPNYYALVVATSGGLAYGVKVNFAGTIIARDGIYIASNVQGTGDNLPTINVKSGAKILVDEHTGTAICAAGRGIWNLDAAIIAGGNGIMAESGALHLCGTAITASGSPIPNSSDPEAPTSGHVIRFTRMTGVWPPEVTIAGGNYLSEQGYLFVADSVSTPIKKLEIKSGQFAGKLGIFQKIAPHGADNSATVITGGEFAGDISGYLAPGFCLEKSAKRNLYQVINIIESRAEAKEAQITQRFEEKLKIAAYYLNPKYVAGDLGPWRAKLSPTLSTLKRINTSARKLLDKKTNLDKMLAATRSLVKAIKNVQRIEEDLRAEVITAITSVEAIDVNDYTSYSYRELHQAAMAAAKVMNQDEVTIEDLYSSLLDIEINIDLLEERGGEEPLEESVPIDPTELIIVSSALAAEAEVARTNPDSIEEEEIAPPKLDAPRLGRLTLAAVMPPTAKIVETEPEEVSQPAPILAVEPELESEAEPELKPAPTLAEFMNTPARPALTQTPSPNQEAVLEPTLAPEPAPAPLDETTRLARQNLSEMVAAVENLRISDYREDAAEQFGELQVAVARATALLAKNDFNLDQVVTVMNDINVAMSGLRDADHETMQPAPVPVVEPTVTVTASPPIVETPSSINWNALQDVVTEISRLDSNNYTANSYTWLLTCLENAKALVVNQAVTQAQIDDAVFEINLAMLALEPVPTPRLSEASDLVSNANPSTSSHDTTTLSADNLTVTPNWLMSMMAGAYAGLATYRSSRLAAKQRRRQA